MIIIKTANGDRFINESEAQSVTHNKEYGYVVITFKDGHSENAFQVESMYYTNKQDVEIRDNGLLRKSGRPSQSDGADGRRNVREPRQQP